MQRWLCDSDQAYKMAGVIQKGILVCTEGIFTLLEDIFNQMHSNEGYIIRFENASPILNTKVFLES